MKSSVSVGNLGLGGYLIFWKYRYNTLQEPEGYSGHTEREQES